MTAVGSKRIEEIQKGDIVLSYDDNVGRYEETPVTDVFVNETDELTEITVGDETIVCTPGHMFLTVDGWKSACDLSNGDMLKTLGRDEKVVGVRRRKLESTAMVYNFSVIGCHTYAVGKTGTIVHNGCLNRAKSTATHKVKYKYRGEVQKAYNKNGKDIYYALDRSNHGGSIYKGFRLIERNTKLEWVGDFDENFVRIIGKHKSAEILIFKVINITPL